MKLSTLDKAILRTLNYSLIFDFPLASEEIHARLIAHKSSLNKVNNALDDLLSSGHIYEHKGYYSTHKNINSLYHNRLRGLKISQTKLNVAEQKSKLLSAHPNVLAVFLTGTVAVKNAKKDDDIDLMIITREGRLWSTRLILTPLLDLLGARRRPSSSSFKDLLCLNIYLSSSHLTLPKSKRNLYTAYELVQSRPLIDKHDLTTLLIRDNAWILDYLPNTPIPPRVEAIPPLRPSPLERFAYRLQLRYMNRKKTIESITPHSAFFHPKNLAPDIISKLDSYDSD